MFWADELADEILAKQKASSFWVDDMKTPSGRIHVGALRGVIIHGLLHQIFQERGLRSDFSYVFNDLDPMDGFPCYLPEKFREYMGRPLSQVPSPEKGFTSLAECYAHEFTEVFHRLGFQPQIFWSSRLYKEGKFDVVIRRVLDRVEKVRELYQNISHYAKPADWYPFQPICPRCGKIGSTLVTGWDGKKVHFRCQPDLVKWCQGCGYEGDISPFGGNGKLMWKVDWAAHWQVIGVTVEGAGKDHMTEGGSYDLSSAICREVFERPSPYGFLYEWFLARGGVKMSSSKGVGVSAGEISDTLPPEILRFLLVGTHYRRAIIFDPQNNQSLLDLFDQYDAGAGDYWEKGDPVKARAFVLSQPGAVPEKHFLPRFREVVKVAGDPKQDAAAYFEKAKKSPLTSLEKEELASRLRYAKIWLKTYAPEKFVYTLTDRLSAETQKLDAGSRQFLKDLLPLFSRDWDSPEDLQAALYEKVKSGTVEPKKAFQALYLTLIGKNYGPKIAWLVLDIGLEKVTARLKEVLSDQTKTD